MADVGKAAASVSGGLVEFSGFSEGNAERDAHRFFSRYNLRLPLNLAPIRPDKPDGIKGLKLQD